MSDSVDAGASPAFSFQLLIRENVQKQPDDFGLRQPRPAPCDRTPSCGGEPLLSTSTPIVTPEARIVNIFFLLALPT